MSQSFDIIAILTAKPGREAELAAVLSACVAPSQAEPGCLTYKLHLDRDRPSRFVFVERWANEAAFNAHKTTAHFGKLIQDSADLLASEPDGMVVETVA